MAQTPQLPPKGKTDVIFQEVRLYIEGVQVPFISISISSQIGSLPSATISVPPQSGMMDIARYYSPKVHVFYIDQIDGVEKVLFVGFITSINYSKSTGGSGSTAISYQCAHKYFHLANFLVDYSGWTQELINPYPNEGAAKSPALSSEFAIGLAMTGIFKDQSLAAGLVEVNQENMEADLKANPQTHKTSPAVLPEDLSDFASRMVGVPGIMLNFWNQMKMFAYSDIETNEVMTKLYIPVMEQGLAFFRRLNGHFYIENKIEDDRIDPCVDLPSAAANMKKRIVPPGFRTFIRSAVQTEMAVKLAQSVLQFSGEVASVMGIWQRLMDSMDYEMIFLSSPAEAPLLDIQGNTQPSSSSNTGLNGPPRSVPTSPFTTTVSAAVTGSTLTYAADTIVKPQIPYYYSPINNVILPNMIESISVSQDEFNIPTRINIRNDEGIPGLDTNYRAPASIREAIAKYAGVSTKSVASAAGLSADDIAQNQRELSRTGDTNIPGTRDNQTITTTAPPVPNVPNQNLGATLGPSHAKVGLYEQGRGIKFEKMLMPKWLSFFSASLARDPKGQDGFPDPTTDPDNYKAIVELAQGWETRYGIANSKLNPWSQDSGLKAYQRLLVASADYEYSTAVARSKAGQVSCIFNPYIIPGYPMDIIDSTPNHPSFHAYCTSVTHSITAGSIGTVVSFASAMTYTEMANYYQPPVHPWIQYTLRLAKQQTIINNVEAKAVADDFYYKTLGVRAASPDDLYDFATGLIKPVARTAASAAFTPGVTGSFIDANGGEMNQMLTATGNSELAWRPIESRTDVENREDLKFIEMNAGNYNPQAVKYTDPNIATKTQMELGQSPFLDYLPKFPDTFE